MLVIATLCVLTALSYSFSIWQWFAWINMTNIFLSILQYCILEVKTYSWSLNNFWVYLVIPKNRTGCRILKRNFLEPAWAQGLEKQIDWCIFWKDIFVLFDSLFSVRKQTNSLEINYKILYQFRSCVPMAMREGYI